MYIHVFRPIQTCSTKRGQLRYEVKCSCIFRLSSNLKEMEQCVSSVLPHFSEHDYESSNCRYPDIYSAVFLLVRALDQDSQIFFGGKLIFSCQAQNSELSMQTNLRRSHREVIICEETVEQPIRVNHSYTCIYTAVVQKVQLCHYYTCNVNAQEQTQKSAS